MHPLNLDEVCEHVNETIGDFHQTKARSLEELHLEKLLTKNPYLFRAKNITTANELVVSLLDAFLSSSEEKIFGDFMEDLAVFVAEETSGGHKSSAPGIDLRLKQSKRTANIQPVLGICYGRTRTSYVRGYLKVVGQNFWYLISENKALYTDIVEPLGYKAKDHNEAFLQERSRVINRLTKQFIDRFCDVDGGINWVKLVEFNSGNYDLDKFLPST